MAETSFRRPVELDECDAMKLIVGLGNPGSRYSKTRHNVGFDVLAELARRHSTDRPKMRFQGEAVEARIGSEKVLLLCPQTYMNKSGESVQPAQGFFKIELNEILVVCDDFNLPTGRLRIRTKGSAGGQKGLSDILRRLGSNEVPRLRVGIGPPPENWDVADFVLSRFSAEEQAEMETTVRRAADAAACWVTDGVETCMNQFNA